MLSALRVVVEIKEVFYEFGVKPKMSFEIACKVEYRKTSYAWFAVLETEHALQEKFISIRDLQILYDIPLN